MLYNSLVLQELVYQNLIQVVGGVKGHASTVKYPARHWSSDWSLAS